MAGEPGTETMADPPPARGALAGAETTDNSLFGRNAWGLNLLCCFANCFTLPERTAAVELFLGEYYGTITEPGFYCRNSCTVEIRRITTALASIDLPNVKVADSRGSPLKISAVVTFQVADARKAAIDVTDPFAYVKDQAPAVLKRVVSQYPYEPATGAPNEPSLRTETETVSAKMRQQLQERVTVAGLRIESFMLNELSYAPEIAQAMLRRQQAGALIDARSRIVQGAVEVTTDAVNKLGDSLGAEDKSKLLSNMLLVLVGEKEATPTIALA